jgi:hypothetical protein
MGVTTNIYGVSVSFYRKLAIFGRIVTSQMDFEGKFELFLNVIKTYIPDHYVQQI